MIWHKLQRLPPFPSFSYFLLLRPPPSSSCYLPSLTPSHSTTPPASVRNPIVIKANSAKTTLPTKTYPTILSCILDCDGERVCRQGNQSAYYNDSSAVLYKLHCKKGDEGESYLTPKYIAFVNWLEFYCHFMSLTELTNICSCLVCVVCVRFSSKL